MQHGTTAKIVLRERTHEDIYSVVVELTGGRRYARLSLNKHQASRLNEKLFTVNI